MIERSGCRDCSGSKPPVRYTIQYTVQIPEEDIVAYCTADPLADVATQECLSDRISCLKPIPRSATSGSGNWDHVYGEILIFDDPESRLPVIDRRKGFPPGVPSLYRRVLVPIYISEQISPA